MDSLESINSSSVSLSQHLNISNLSLSMENFEPNPDTERKFQEIFLGKKMKYPQNLREDTKYSTLAYPNLEIKSLSNEILSLKQTLTGLISQMNQKDKENNKSSEKFKKLASLSDKNKEKIKKLKKTVSFHQDKIMSLENNLNFLFDIFSDRHLRDKKNVRLVFIDRFNLPSSKLSSCRGVNLLIKGPGLRSKGVN